MFKVGDKVRRKAQYRTLSDWARLAGAVDGVYIVATINTTGSLGLVGVAGDWYADKFELVEEEPVVEKQVPGVPDGYRLVGIRTVKRGEAYIKPGKGLIEVWDYSYESGGVYPVVEPIVPPKPKTVTVVINKYLVGDLADPRSLYVAYCTQDYMEQACVPYRLLGVSETLEVEVDV